MSANAYYNYKKNRKEAYHLAKEAIKSEILDIYHEYDGNPGHRMMKVFLNRKQITLSKTTTLKYMKELGIRSVVVRKRPRYHKGECYKKFPNHMNQDFTASRPNEKWCTDFTYLYLSDGAKRYNCSILDLYDKSIVASTNGKHITAELAITTLKRALNAVPQHKNLMLHSDMGPQFTSQVFTEFCDTHGIQQSMSKAGCPYDNAPMERFYGTFKGELINKHRFETDEHLNIKVADYVFGYYNHIRPHSSNDYQTPFEKRYSKP